ncbi:MAG: putative Rossmann fold flavoprotein [Paracoccaceae bacterium]|jgi:predicted Rossmann fold flavoprotein
MKIAIIGGGAAGFFCAINAAEKLPQANITIYEASNKLLAKVLISGGGRCNVTNTISEPSVLAANYPRGREFLEPIFHTFTSSDTQEWFTTRGVPLKTEADGRVFPQSDNSQSIYKCLLNETRRLNISVLLSKRLKSLIHEGEKWQLDFGSENVQVDKVVLATGSNKGVYDMLAAMDVEIVPPLPSLFTFNAKQHTQLELAGLSVPDAHVSIMGIQNSREVGPVLITHWGYTAPAILRLSAWYARELSALDYTFNLKINWAAHDSKKLTALFKSYAETKPKERVVSWKEHNLPKRLWQYLFEAAALPPYTNWSEIGKKGIVRLVTVLCAYESAINGKSTFKEEFVTAGGIALTEVNNDTFEIIKYKGLYAVGELLNIDAITGGFNFQAAWSGGYMAAKSLAQDINA